MNPTRDDIVAWLHTVLAKTGETPSGLARRAGLATTTLTRFLNDPASPMLQLRSIAKIAHVAGVQPIGIAAVTGTGAVPAFRAGMSEPDAVPLDDPETGIAAALELLIAGRNAADPWTLKSRAIEDAGYLPGDILIVDLNRQPVAGDVVCAQAYRWAEGKAETLFRLFEPPYLVAACRDPALRKPLLVDNNQVIVKGVVTEMLRRAKAA